LKWVQKWKSAIHRSRSAEPSGHKRKHQQNGDKDIEDFSQHKIKFNTPQQGF